MDNLEELDLALLRIRSDHLEEQHSESIDLIKRSGDNDDLEMSLDNNENDNDMYRRNNISEMRINLRNGNDDDDNAQQIQEEVNDENSFDIGTFQRNSSHQYNLRAEARDYRIRFS